MSKAEWTGKDMEAADEAGWGIFECCKDPHGAAKIVDGRPYGDRPYELQSNDEEPFFDQDVEAWQHVWDTAEVGPADCLEARALAFLAEHSPNEYDAIKRRCSGH